MKKMRTQTTRPRRPLSSRRAAKNPALEAKLRQLALGLAPLVQLTTGRVHPAFPRTLLAFWLLTDEQLEALAHFYHQRTPCRLTADYPCPVIWASHLPIEEKRRKMGRFIGLRGCESPVLQQKQQEPTLRLPSEEEIEENARRARLAADEELFRRKGGWY